MLDKIKSLMEMQKKMQEIKNELDGVTFDMESGDGLVKITMNGSQEAKKVSIRGELKGMDKAALEKAIQDAYLRAVKRSYEIAASRMKDVAGLGPEFFK
jgi:DNA-binding YbaB/EbfC family protein